MVSKDDTVIEVLDVVIEKLDEPIKVYNLEVEENHNYFVSESKVLVHNSCGDDGATEANVPDSPSSLQKEVEKGRAPKDVDRVDKPHVEGQKPHIHFKDKTSLNNDGTIHDKHRGMPDVSNKVRKWLESHGWRVND